MLGHKDPPLVDMKWMEHAACQGVSQTLFFPSHEKSTKGPSGPDAYRRARAICNRCPVRQECLNYALEVFPTHDDDHGMWGGMSPQERRKYKRKLRKRVS